VPMVSRQIGLGGTSQFSQKQQPTACAVAGAGPPKTANQADRAAAKTNLYNSNPPFPPVVRPRPSDALITTGTELPATANVKTHMKREILHQVSYQGDLDTTACVNDVRRRA